MRNVLSLVFEKKKIEEEVLRRIFGLRKGKQRENGTP
jgi:hypothetical protein